MKPTYASLARPLAGLSAFALLAGCGGGHGKYTQEHLNSAQEAMMSVKSATEYDMAHQAFLAGDLDKALKSVDRSIAINGSVAKSHVLRGRILTERGDLEPAIESLRKAETLDPLNAEALYYQGIIHENFSQKAEALACYEKAATLETSNPQYVLAAAEMMMDLERLDEAEAYLLAQKSTFEHNAGIRQTLAHIAMLRGDGETAVTLFNEARLFAPDDPTILEDLVRAQISTGRFAEAEYHLDKLTKIPGNEGRRDLLHMRARCLTNVDRPVEARDILVALTKDAAGGQDTDAWIALGNVAWVLNDMRNLQNAANRVIALAPGRVEGYTLKGLFHRKRGELAQALTAFDAAVERRGLDATPLALRGLVQQDLGRTADARRSFSEASQADPSNPLFTKLLASVDSSSPVANVPENAD
jgi:Flp pilus assembly protein TadD